MDYRFLAVLIEYADYFTSQVEAAVVEGVLPWDALELMRTGMVKAWEKRQKSTV